MEQQKNNVNYTIQFNYRHGKIRLSLSVLKGLNNPRYVQFFVDGSEHKLMVVGVDEYNVDCITNPLLTNQRRKEFVLNGQPFIKKLCDLMSWDLINTHRVLGELDEGSRCVTFDLNNKIIAEQE